MKKSFLKCVSLAVMISVVAGMMFSTGVATDTSDFTADMEPIAAANEDAILVQEVETLRSEYEKHFLMSDGTYTVMTYNEPVHKNEDGNWVEVNNTLALNTLSDGTTRYTTTDGIADVSFANQFKNELVTMSDGDYSVSWGLTAMPATTGGTISTQTVTAMLPSRSTDQLSAVEQKASATLSTSAIRYENALAQNVDLEYVVLPSRVKESILLQSPANVSAYVMNIQTVGLSARLLSSREIEFYNADDEVIFTMWAPYMYDSAGELSQNITVELAAVRAGQYLVKITPDAAWLSSPNRVYPVIIDPDISVDRTRTNIIDNFVMEGSGNQDRNLDRLYIGKKDGSVVRTFLRYDTLPTLPAGAEIEEATQTLYITANTSSGGTASAYAVTGGSWASGTIAWANMPAANTLIESNISHNNFTEYVFDCTEIVQSWYEGTLDNNGIMLRYTNESINDYNAFYSADRSTESQRPLLTINYSLSGDIVWPVPGYYTISSSFGYRSYDNKVHRGIDIVCDGVPVHAATSGIAVLFEDDSAGVAADVRHSDTTFRTRYFHLTAGSYMVSQRQYVTAGTLLALSGNTGTSSGPHLHFQLQWGSDKYQVYNPLTRYGQLDPRYNNSALGLNPNPMFVLVGGVYVPNNDFDYTYEHSIFNCAYYTDCPIHGQFFA